MSSFKLKKDRKLKKKDPSLKNIEELHEEKMHFFKDLYKKSPGNKLTIEYDEITYLNEVHMILKEYFEIQDETKVIDIENLNNKIKLSRKQELTEMYYDVVGIEYKKHKLSGYFCVHCSSLMYDTKERFLVCSECGIAHPDKIIDGTSYQEEIDNKVFVYDYKRINYFKEWLNQIQAKEITDLPEDLIQNLKNEIRKKGITKEKLTSAKLKKILKETNNSKFYEHIPLIISRIYNCSSLNIPQEICIKLKDMFLLIQQPFEKLKGNRINFFSYPYILYKFCEILGLRDYLKHFSLLKSREKLMKQDILWKKIINVVKETTGDPMWTFTPSC